MQFFFFIFLYLQQLYKLLMRLFPKKLDAKNACFTEEKKQNCNAKNSCCKIYRKNSRLSEKKSKLIIIQIELKTSKRFQYKKIFFYIVINYRTKILLMFQVVFRQDRTYHKAF